MSVASLSEAPRALITGLRGFTGQYLAKELEAAGYQVFGTAHGAEPTGPGVHSIDLCNRNHVKQLVTQLRPSLVAHLAAISFVAHGDVDAIYQVNVLGSRNLLEALAELDTPPRCVLMVSSGQVYGNYSSDCVLSESSGLLPSSDYAISKLAMEYMARLWMDRLPIVLARPFNYTGVGQAPRFLLPKVIGHFQRGEKSIELGNIEVERDFSDVRFVAKAYCKLLQIAPASEVFNICSGTAWSITDVLKMMAEIAGYEIEVKINPAFVRENEVKRLLGDAGKLKSIIGQLNDIPLKETLRWMYASA